MGHPWIPRAISRHFSETSRRGFSAWRRGFMKLRGSYFSIFFNASGSTLFFCFDWVLARARAVAPTKKGWNHHRHPIYPGRRVTSWRPRITSSTFGAPLTTTRWISPMRSGSEAFLTIDAKQFLVFRRSISQNCSCYQPIHWGSHEYGLRICKKDSSWARMTFDSKHATLLVFI